MTVVDEIHGHLITHHHNQAKENFMEKEASTLQKGREKIIVDGSNRKAAVMVLIMEFIGTMANKGGGGGLL